jgi:hypothetical protein
VFGSDVISRIPADHERLADGAVLQQPEHPFPNAQNISYRAGATSQQHGIDLAKKEGRPFQYVQEKTRKDDVAKEIAARDKIEEGLIVVLIKKTSATGSMKTHLSGSKTSQRRKNCRTD